MKQSNGYQTEKANLGTEKLLSLSNDLLDFLANPKLFLSNLLKEVLVETTTSHTPPPAPEPQLVGFEQAYELYLKEFYKKGYVYILVSKGAIPYQKIGKKIVFDRATLKQWIAGGRYHYGKQQTEQKTIDYLQQKNLSRKPTKAKSFKSKT